MSSNNASFQFLACPVGMSQYWALFQLIDFYNRRNLSWVRVNSSLLWVCGLFVIVVPPLVAIFSLALKNGWIKLS